MEARDNGNLMIGHGVNQTVGETANARPPKLSPYRLISEGILQDRGKGHVDGMNKLSPQPYTSLVIPVPRFANLGLGLPPDNQFPIHL
jgi:hypothetical protein